MKRITLWAVAAVVALATTAAIGVASASAGTVLCSKAESVCANENVRPAGGNVALGTAPGLGKFRINAGLATVNCGYAVINSISTAEIGNPLPGQSEVGVYPENCQATWVKPNESCKSITFNNPKETYEATGSGAGTINIGSASEPLTVSYVCYSPYFKKSVECGYQAKSAIPIHYDGYIGTIKSAEAALTLVSTNGYCNTAGSLEAELERAGGDFISTHTATVLCSKAESVCANANVLPAGEDLPLAVANPNGFGYGKFLFSGGLGGVECEYAVINSTSTAAAGNPLLGQSEVGVYPENCGTWLRSGNTQHCKSLTINSPAETYEATGGGAGVIYVGSGSEPLTISFACYSPLAKGIVECTYKAKSAVPVHFDGYEATINKTEATTSLVSGSKSCVASGSLEAELVKANGGFISTI